MAGGYFVALNKVIPGAYVNFTTSGSNDISVGERGVVAMPLALDFGAEKQFMLLDADSDFQALLGYDISHEKLILIRETLKKAKYLLLYRINSGTPASVTANGLTITATYKGIRGNDLTVSIAADADVAGSFIVTTYLDGVAVATESASTIAGLSGNDYVIFSGTGSLVASAGMILTGGTTTAATSADYTTYFTALEVQEFNVIGLPITDNTIKAAATSFVKRMIEEEGKKIQLVVPEYSTADHEGVISVENGVVLSDGTVIDKVKAVAWVAGSTAGAEINEDLTYTAYDDAVDVTEKYTNTQITAMLKAGKFFFVPKKFKTGSIKIVVQEDINTFTSFTATKGSEFRLNRSVRTIFDIGTTLPQLWEQYYIGKVDATEDGGNVFRGDCLEYFGNLQEMNAIKSFADEDISVTVDDNDNAVAAIGIQIVKSFKKLYLSVKLN